MWQTPKTNWTSVDVYLASDLNRVEGNTQYVAEVLASQGYPVPTMAYKTDWNKRDILLAPDFNRIEGNVQTLGSIYFKSGEWQALKTNWIQMDSVDYTFANRVEINLKILQEILETMQRQYIRAGVGALGQNRIYLHRWRG